MLWETVGASIKSVCWDPFEVAVVVTVTVGYPVYPLAVPVHASSIPVFFIILSAIPLNLDRMGIEGKLLKKNAMTMPGIQGKLV